MGNWILIGVGLGGLLVVLIVTVLVKNAKTHTHGGIDGTHFDASDDAKATTPDSDKPATPVEAVAPAVAHSAGRDSRGGGRGGNWFLSALKFVGWAIVVFVVLGIFYGLFGQDLFTWATRPHVIHEIPRGANGQVLHTQTYVTPPAPEPSSVGPGVAQRYTHGDCSVMPNDASTVLAGDDYGPPIRTTPNRTICTDVPVASPHLISQCRLQGDVGDWLDWGSACGTSAEIRFKSAITDQNTGQVTTFPVRLWEVDARPVD